MKLDFDHEAIPIPLEGICQGRMMNGHWQAASDRVAHRSRFGGAERRVLRVDVVFGQIRVTSATARYGKKYTLLLKDPLILYDGKGFGDHARLL
jgi:hypothetical protein